MERKGIKLVKREIDKLEKHIKFYQSSQMKDARQNKKPLMDYNSAIAEARTKQGIWITTLMKMEKLNK